VSDQTTSERTGPTPASLGLAIALGVIYLVQLALDGVAWIGIVRMGATYPALVQDGAWWALFSSTLLHLSMLHVAANAYFVAIVGGRVERVVGTPRMLVVFFLGGLGGSVLSVLLTPNVVGAGASGGAWGLMLAELALVGMPVLRDGEPAPATWGESLRLVALNALFSFLPGIDALAHFGGGFAGFLVVLVGHWARRIWWPLAGLLTVAHLGALGWAIRVGEPWTGFPPLGETIVHDDVEQWVTLTLPERVAPIQGRGLVVDAGRLWFEGLVVSVELVQRPAGVAREVVYRGMFEGEAAPYVDCGAGCTSQIWRSESGTGYLVARAYGSWDLLTTVFVDDLAPDTYGQWDIPDAARLSAGGREMMWVLADDLLGGDDPAGGLEVLEALIREAPDDGRFLNTAAWALATHPDDAVRDGARAVTLAERALAAQPGDASVIDTLAAAFAESGDFDRAVATQERAVALSDDAELQEHLTTLQQGRPIRE